MQVWLEASWGGREEGSEISLHSADCLGRALPRLVLPCCLLSSCHILHMWHNSSAVQHLFSCITLQSNQGAMRV